MGLDRRMASPAAPAKPVGSIRDVDHGCKWP
jgi:hypothetical protein